MAIRLEEFWVGLPEEAAVPIASVLALTIAKMNAQDHVQV